MIGGGSDRVLIVMTAHEANPLLTVTGVTYDGQALTLAGAQEAISGLGQRVEMWYLLESDLPAAGTYTATVSWSGNASPGIAVLSLEGWPSARTWNSTCRGCSRNFSM